MKKNENLYKIIIAVAILIVALSVAYYYVIVLPGQENARIAREELKEESNKQEELDIKRRDIAKNVQDDCLNKAKKITNSFDLDNTYESPLFFPYQDPSSFNDNDEIVVALSSYQSCIISDPRYSSDNITLNKIYRDSVMAQLNIEIQMLEAKEDNPSICDSNLLSERARNKCNFLKLEDILWESALKFNEVAEEPRTEEEIGEYIDSYVEDYYREED
jgi:hypothetical protein